MFPISDYLLWLHGKDTAQVGTALCAGGSEASALYLDAGKTYSDFGGKPGLGLHIVVTTTFTTLTGILFEIVHAASAPTTTNVIGARYLALADLVAGKHYFIPFYAKTILHYLGFYGLLDGSNAGAGKVCAWIGTEGPEGAD